MVSIIKVSQNAAEVVDVAVIEGKVKDVTVSDAEVEDKFTIPIHYLFHMVM